MRISIFGADELATNRAVTFDKRNVRLAGAADQAQQQMKVAVQTRDAHAHAVGR